MSVLGIVPETVQGLPVHPLIVHATVVGIVRVGYSGSTAAWSGTASGDS